MADSEHSTEMSQLPQSKRVAFHNQEHGQEPGSTSPLLTPLTPKASEPERRQFINSARRHRTDLNDHRVIESRAFRHAQMFRRPRALDYESLDDDSTKAISPATTRSRSSFSSRGSGNTEDDAEERGTDDIPKMRSRLNLFVDLIWVGIIANLSGNFGEQAFQDNQIGVGIAVAEFILLFIVIWRVWDSLRVYTSSFFVDDIIQRNFTLWILVLAVLYGINAPYAYGTEGKGSLTLLIVVYIIAKVGVLQSVLSSSGCLRSMFAS